MTQFMGTFSSRPSSDGYRSGWDRVFGRRREEVDGGEVIRERALPTGGDDPGPGADAAAVHAWLDRAMDERAAAGGAEPACGKGCSACCQQAVGVFGWEADRLAEAVAELPDRVRDEIGRLVALDVRRGFDLLDPWPEDRQPRIDWREQGRSCPLNDRETGACLVWDSRPSVCRLYNVIDGPEGVCDVPGARGLSVPFVDLLERAGRINGTERRWLPLALAERL